MNRTITIYGKQEAITYTTDQGVIMVHETESHLTKDIAKTLSEILKTKITTSNISFRGITGKAIYNEGCRVLDFNLAFIQK